MSLLTTVKEASVAFTAVRLDPPLVISSGRIDELTLATASVRVEVDGRVGAGQGAILLSDLWAWPDPARSHAERDAAMRAVCQGLATNLWGHCGGEPQHPLELGLRLHETVAHAPGELPALARSLCLSPFDAAIHDAVGQATNRSAFTFYQEAAALPTAEAWLGAAAWRQLDQLLVPPRRSLRAWYIISHPDHDPALATWVRDRGYHCFKLKLSGDLATDLERTRASYDRVAALGARSIELTVDANQAYPDVAAVVAYLDRLEREAPAAYAALTYLEQPTSQDIERHPGDWRPVARRKPVLLDEGLSALDRLPLAQDQGWSGLALKTCKGQSLALTAAAWARQHGMCISLQDLTNPGLALIHAALLAAHLPTINDVELNSPQFMPPANAGWSERLPALFAPHDGCHRLPATIPVGLGSRL